MPDNTNTDADKELAALRQQTSHGDRLDDAADTTTTAPFTETLIAELESIDAGETQKAVSVWDGPFAAFLHALEDHPDEMAAVGTRLQDALGASTDQEVDRSEVIRLTLRLGLTEASPDHMAALREAVQQHAVDKI